MADELQLPRVDPRERKLHSSGRATWLIVVLLLIATSHTSGDAPGQQASTDRRQLHSLEERGADISRNFYDDEYRYGYLVITLGPDWSGGNEGVQGLKNLGREKLYELVLDSPHIDDAALEHVPGVHLQGLTVKQSKISDAGLQHLIGLEDFQSLLIDDGAQITNEGLRLLQKHKLKWLQIENATQLSDDGLENLAGMTDLMWLRLTGAPFTGQGLGSWAGMRELRTLDLSRTQVDDEAVLFIARFSRLQRLDLSHTRVRGVALRHLNQLQTLWELSLDGTDFGDDDLQYLSGLKSLRVLSLRGTRVTAAAADQLSLEHLKTVLLD